MFEVLSGVSGQGDIGATNQGLGIKTSAVVAVGTAIVAAFIGALIVRGLALNDVGTILAGAIPAAAMALVIHGMFEVLDRVVIPRALR